MTSYWYEIGRLWPAFDTLSEAKKHMHYVIMSDKNTHALNRNNVEKYYVLRGIMKRDGQIGWKRFYL